MPTKSINLVVIEGGRGAQPIDLQELRGSASARKVVASEELRNSPLVRDASKHSHKLTIV